MSFNYRAPCLLVEVQETEAGALMKGNSARISDSDTISRLGTRGALKGADTIYM